MNKLLAVSTLALMIGFAGAAHAQYQGAMAPRGGFTGPGLAVSTVAEANKMSDDQPVVLVGQPSCLHDRTRSVPVIPRMTDCAVILSAA